METPEEKLERALTYLVELLNESEPSAYARKSPSDLLPIISENLASVKLTGCLASPGEISEMFLPTASLQEIAMDNGWGSQYLELSYYFDRELAG